MLTHRAKSSTAIGLKPGKQPSTVQRPPSSTTMLLKTDLTGHKLVHIPSAELKQDLAWLVLDDNLISQIGSQALPPQLQHLSMERNQLIAVYTSEVEHIRSTLKTLSLKQNKLQSVQALSVCSQLKDLNLAGNSINDTMICSTVPSLKKLRRLDLSGNRLQNGFKVMDAIHGLRGLKILKMSENAMVSQLRLDVGRHYRLKELYADHNKF